MSAQRVLLRLKFYSLPFQTATTQILYAPILKIVREIINYRKKKMVLIDYCGNSFSVWVLWKALLIMKLWTDSRHFTGQH